MVQKSQTTTWDEWNPVNNGISYQPQLVSWISSIHRIIEENLPRLKKFGWNSQDINWGQDPDVLSLNHQTVAIRCCWQGSLYYQPKQCTIVRGNPSKIPATSTFAACLIPSQMGNEEHAVFLAPLFPASTLPSVLDKASAGTTVPMSAPPLLTVVNFTSASAIVKLLEVTNQRGRVESTSWNQTGDGITFKSYRFLSSFNQKKTCRSCINHMFVGKIQKKTQGKESPKIGYLILVLWRTIYTFILLFAFSLGLIEARWFIAFHKRL